MTQPLSSALEEQIIAVEEQLRLAMRSSDVAVLDHLIADDLVFTSHLGQVISKQDDLAFHQAGLCQFQTIDYSERYIQPIGDRILISVRVYLTGIYGEIPFEEDLRFTRLWQRSPQGTWQIIVGHSSVVQSNSNAPKPSALQA